MTSSKLTLSTATYEELLAHAREGAANDEEVCGVVGGERGVVGGERGTVGEASTDDTRVTEIRRVPNVAARPRRRYELDPAETLAAIEDLETAGVDHVGFYHSHPEGPDEPSAVDRTEATWTGYLHLIVSLGGDDPTVGAWRWRGDEFAPVRVV
ncbi:MAG: desampylase, partial [Halobacteriota archaeon]